MKKILKQGSIKRWVKRCPYCDTEFEYESGDIMYNQTVHHAVVTCPSCNNELFHYNSNYSTVSTENF